MNSNPNLRAIYPYTYIHIYICISVLENSHYTLLKEKACCFQKHRGCWWVHYQLRPCPQPCSLLAAASAIVPMQVGVCFTSHRRGRARVTGRYLHLLLPIALSSDTGAVVSRNFTRASRREPNCRAELSTESPESAPTSSVSNSLSAPASEGRTAKPDIGSRLNLSRWHSLTISRRHFYLGELINAGKHPSARFRVKGGTTLRTNPSSCITKLREPKTTTPQVCQTNAFSSGPSAADVPKQIVLNGLNMSKSWSAECP